MRQIFMRFVVYVFIERRKANLIMILPSFPQRTEQFDIYVHPQPSSFTQVIPRCIEAIGKSGRRLMTLSPISKPTTLRLSNQSLSANERYVANLVFAKSKIQFRSPRFRIA